MLPGNPVLLHLHQVSLSVHFCLSAECHSFSHPCDRPRLGVLLCCMIALPVADSAQHQQRVLYLHFLKERQTVETFILFQCLSIKDISKLQD